MGGRIPEKPVVDDAGSSCRAALFCLGRFSKADGRIGAQGRILDSGGAVRDAVVDGGKVALARVIGLFFQLVDRKEEEKE